MPIIQQVLKNLLIKAVNAPYSLLARAFDADEDDLRNVHFLFLQQELTGKQEKLLDIFYRHFPQPFPVRSFRKHHEERAWLAEQHHD